MRRLLAGVAVIVMMAGSFWGASAVCAAEAAQDGKLKVITTLFPLYDWAGVIGGDKADVTLLLPPGVEPHSFEPTPRDIIAINKADLLIYTGELMEPWVEDIIRGVTNQNLTVVDTSEGIRLMDGSGKGEPHHSGEKEAHRHEAEAHHSHSGKDPHIWLEFGNAQKMVKRIAGAFAEKDPDDAALYTDRAEEYNARLEALDQAFEKALSTCKHKTLMYGGHFAFGYFAERYGLSHISPYHGFTPNAEPTPKSITELIENMKRSGMQSVFYEEGVDPRVARVIAEETGAELLLLHGAHNVTKDELAQGVSYLSVMEGNLKRLKQGLECR